MSSLPEQLLPEILDQLLDAVFLVDLQGTIVYVSAACEPMLGYSPAEMIGRRMLDFVAPEDRERTQQQARLVMAGEPKIGFENRYVHKAGHYVPLMWSARIDTTAQLRVGVARDISVRKRLEERQAATYALSEAVHDARDLAQLFHEVQRIMARLVPLAGFAIVLQSLPSGVLLAHFRCEPEQSRRFTSALVRARAIEVMRAGHLMPLWPLATAAAIREDDHHGVAVPLVTAGETIGSMLLCSGHAAGYTEADRELVSFVSSQVATAVRRKQLATELERAARFDALTGLPNRRHFQERLPVVWSRCQRHQRRFALLFIDIDAFKQVNDAHGHLVGDALLQTLARRLQTCVREEDAVFRLGGDEFVALLEDVHDEAEARYVADRLLTVIAEPMPFDALTLQCRVSLGLALYPDHADSLEDLLHRADAAMYARKRGARAA